MPAAQQPTVQNAPNMWEPANDVERQLGDAVRATDLAAMIGILAAAPLFLPGLADPADGGQRVLTRARDGVPYLLVFTSTRTMNHVVGAESWRATTLADMVRDWPDPAWGLAVNPTTPVGLLVAPEQVPMLVRSPESMARFEPANDVERLLRDALLALDGEVLFDVLITAKVVVPTPELAVEGVPTVAVFTSPQRCTEFQVAAGVDLPTVTMDLVAVLRQWPGSEYRLAVNPASPIAFSLGAERVDDLLRYALGLLRRRFGDGAGRNGAGGDGGGGNGAGGNGAGGNGAGGTDGAAAEAATQAGMDITGLLRGMDSG